MVSAMKIKPAIYLLFIILFIVSGCAKPFKHVDIDPSTDQFPTSVSVDKKFIKIFHPLPGIQEVNYVFLQTYTPYGNDSFFEFTKDALLKIGFKRVYNEKELAQMVIQSGLSQYVTNLSDLISLNNLAMATGPFIFMQSRVYRVSDAVYRFDLQLIEPLSGRTFLEISRVRTNWLDMDTEINYPILNTIKNWYDESVKLSYEKPKREQVGKGSL